MERKLVRQGRSALTLTLPAAWTKEKGLRAGDVVNVEARANELAVIAGRKARRQVTSVDLTGCERSMMFHVIMAKYIEGYDEITFVHENPRVAHEIAQSLIGMIVERQTQSRMTVRSIIQEPEDTFDAVLRRCAHMLAQQAAMLIDVVAGTVKPDEVRLQEKYLDQHIMFCLRYLSKYEGGSPSYRQFLVCATLELAGDRLTRIAQFIGKQASLARLLAKHVEEYTRLLFIGDLPKMYTSLRTLRTSIATKTFADGLAYSLAEILYNYIGYVSDTDIRTRAATRASR